MEAQGTLSLGDAPDILNGISIGSGILAAGSAFIPGLQPVAGALETLSIVSGIGAEIVDSERCPDKRLPVEFPASAIGVVGWAASAQSDRRGR